MVFETLQQIYKDQYLLEKVLKDMIYLLNKTEFNLKTRFFK
jgi:hypothetical protein